MKKLLYAFVLSLVLGVGMSSVTLAQDEKAEDKKEAKADKKEAKGEKKAAKTKKKAAKEEDKKEAK